MPSSNTNSIETEEDTTNSTEYELSEADDPLVKSALCLLTVVVLSVENCSVQAAQESLKLQALQTSKSLSSLRIVKFPAREDSNQSFLPGSIMSYTDLPAF